MKNIVLIGFMGTGKTSVGLALAKRLNRQAVDVDAMIEAAEKKKISRIFEERGEAYFRHLEKNMIREASQMDGAVITTGGGAVMDSENVDALKRNGILVCLEASVETILMRVGRSKTRPLLKNAADPRKAIEELMAKRRAHYERSADWTLATDGQSSEQVAEKIERALAQSGMLSL